MTSYKVFFAVDTGFRDVPEGADESQMVRCLAFGEIGDHLGSYDLSLLPIRLCSPWHLLSSVHGTPEDASCLHEDLNSRKFLGMYHGHLGAVLANTMKI